MSSIGNIKVQEGAKKPAPPPMPKEPPPIDAELIDRGREKWKAGASKRMARSVKEWAQDHMFFEPSCLICCAEAAGVAAEAVTLTSKKLIAFRCRFCGNNIFHRKASGLGGMRVWQDIDLGRPKKFIQGQWVEEDADGEYRPRPGKGRGQMFMSEVVIGGGGPGSPRRKEVPFVDREDRVVPPWKAPITPRKPPDQPKKK